MQDHELAEELEDPGTGLVDRDHYSLVLAGCYAMEAGHNTEGGGGIEACGRLIRKEQRWLLHKLTSDAEPLSLAATDAASGFVSHRGLRTYVEVEQVNHVLDPGSLHCVSIAGVGVGLNL